MLQELSTSSSQASFLAWILPVFSPSMRILCLEDLRDWNRLQTRWGMPLAHWCKPGNSSAREVAHPLHKEVCDGDAAMPWPWQPQSSTHLPPHRVPIGLLPAPPRFRGLTDYIYHTCSSQGNGLNFIQYTPSGSAFKTHPQAHFSLSPCNPRSAQPSVLWKQILKNYSKLKTHFIRKVVLNCFINIINHSKPWLQ